MKTLHRESYNSLQKKKATRDFSCLVFPFALDGEIIESSKG